MVQVVQGELPDGAALARYKAIGYTDCFYVDVPKDVSFEAYITAFYTSWLFKMERIVLRLVKRPSTDREVTELAIGTRTRFAAWDVEEREEQQILMCDMAGRTRSWLMVEPAGEGTRLYFGSAVVPDKNSGKMGWLFHAFMGFHKVYSVQLLKAAVRNL
jgi:hypothetical protein